MPASVSWWRMSMKVLPVMPAGPFSMNRPAAALCTGGSRETLMVFDFSVALTWILFLALFPIAFFWLRRVWRILVLRDFTEVALKRGESPPNPEKFAPYDMLGNLISGTVIVVVILSVLWGALDYSTWSAIAGSTIWCKFFFNFALSRHAHGKLGVR
jgi:small-conductance mechanosensitive channel